MTVVTRFAPSPTGFLHIGGARTALFNWLYAKHHNGKFLLRIEDTDRARSTPEATQAIITGLTWLGLDWHGQAVSQFAQAHRHKEIADTLLASGQAYKCYSSPEELEAMREEAKQTGRPVAYNGAWRDRDPAEAPVDRHPVIRLKTPQDGETVITDHIQGSVTFPNSQIDDFVLLRADGTPTYMLAVVVDDHDMGVTHVIRGDDHLNNAARQNALYHALGWSVPTYAHIPLIHGPDGAKLSKRHGALGVEAYEEMGYLPAAMRNYLARLGWSMGDADIFTDQQAIAAFDLSGIGKAPARFDLDILAHTNAHYIKSATPEFLTTAILPMLRSQIDLQELEARLLRSMPALSPRAKTLPELAQESAYLAASRPLTLSDKSLNLLDESGKNILRKVKNILENTDWSPESLEAALTTFATQEELKIGKVFQPMRAALTGGLPSPGVYDILLGLGRTESLDRLADQTI